MAILCREALRGQYLAFYPMEQCPLVPPSWSDLAFSQCIDGMHTAYHHRCFSYPPDTNFDLCSRHAGALHEAIKSSHTMPLDGSRGIGIAHTTPQYAGLEP